MSFERTLQLANRKTLQTPPIYAIVEKLVSTYEILIYETTDGREPFSVWLNSLDYSVKGKVIGKQVVLLISGGDKNLQSQDIKQAKEYLVDYRSRYENKKSPTKLKSWSALKKERFRRDPEEAIAYLKASLEENGDTPEIVIEAIREVSESLGLSIEQIAKKAHKTPSTIHKALSKSGNPTLETLTAVLKALGLRLSVEKAS